MSTSRYIAVLLMLLISHTSYSCDVCGCNANGDSWGIMPNFNRSFIGLKNQWRSFVSTHPNTGDDLSGQKIRDEFFRTDIVMRVGISERIGIVAQVPYRYNYRLEGAFSSTYQGIGDASAFAQFLVVKPTLRLWRHSLFISAGAEAPTGKFKFSHDIPSMLQPGSGTWDFLYGLNYTIRRDDIGVNAELNYRDNGRTGIYEWGDVYSTSLKSFYAFQTDSSLQIMPWIGASFEHYNENTENTKYDISAAYTGGYVSAITGGLDVFSERYSFSVDAAIPLVSSFADDFGKMKFHVGCKFVFYLNTRKLF